MGCSIKERAQLKEVARVEYSRLKDLSAQGYTEDIENGIPDIEAAIENMQAIINGKPEKIVDTGEKIDTDTVFELNMNAPKVNGRPVVILGGTRFEDGKVKYEVRFPNGKKKYEVGSARVTADQVDPTSLGRYGSEAGQEVKVTKDHEKLKGKIWRDQDAAMELFDELAKMDEGVDPEHTAELRELLEQITDPQKAVLNEFKVYLNKEAEANGGAAVVYGKDPKIIINVNEHGSRDGGMSAAEVYVHEMVHMSVEAAKQFNKGPLAGILSDMRELYEQAATTVKISDLAVNGDMKKAERLWEYMFASENGLSEFIAYGMTNKKLRDKLKTIDVKGRNGIKADTVAGKVAGYIVQLWDAIRTMVGKNPADMVLDERLAKLVADLWEHNNQTVDDSGPYKRLKHAAESGREYVDEKLIKAGRKTAEAVTKVLDTVEDLAGDSAVGDIVKGGRAVVRVFNPYKDRKETAAIAQTMRDFELAHENGILGGWLFRQEGSVQKILNYMTRDDDEIAWVEKMGLVGQNIDRHREALIAKIGGDVANAMKGTSNAEQLAITDIVMDLDLKVLNEKYGLKGIKEVLTDNAKLEEALANEEKKLRSMISTDTVYNYYRSQTMGLGHYLATHEGGSSINRNARHIKDMWGTGFSEMLKQDAKLKKNEGEVIKTIDKLATLEGIKKSNKANRDTVVRLMGTHPDAVKKTIEYHEIHSALNGAFKVENEVYTPTVKGEIKDLKAGWIDYTVAPNTKSAQEMMKRRGYTYKGDTAVHGMGMYVAKTAGMAKFEKGAAAKINADKELHNMVGATAAIWDDKNEGIKSGKKKVELTKEKMDAEIKRQFDGVKMPIIDGMIMMAKGRDNVVNFGISANKEMYANAVKQDRKTPILIGKMIGEVQEKKEATALNRVLVKEIYKDMQRNYKRGEVGISSRREYIEIGPSANNKGKGAQEYADTLWRDMPHNIREEILKRPSGKKFIAVRRDMASAYFGRRSPSLLNAKVPFGKGDTFAQMLNKKDMGYVVEAIKLAGDLWQEIISLEKVNVVIKTPKVLIDNIRSNVFLQTVLGQLPWEAIKGQMDMFKATKQYLTDEKEKLALEVKIGSKKGTLEDKARLKRLKSVMKDSPVYDTMQAGLFTGVIDELNLDGLQSTTRGEELLSQATGWIPQIVKDVGSALYINKDTWMFKTLAMVLQYSDFVMRSSRYQYLVSTGMNKDVAMKMVLDEAVNYNRDLGGGMTWVKEMGPWWFFQYFFGANKNMIEKSRSRPSALLAMAGSSMPSPMDASPWEKNFAYTMFGPVDLAFDETTDYLSNPALMRLMGLIN